MARIHVVQPEGQPLLSDRVVSVLTEVMQECKGHQKSVSGVIVFLTCGRTACYPSHGEALPRSISALLREIEELPCPIVMSAEGVVATNPGTLLLAAGDATVLARSTRLTLHGHSMTATKALDLGIATLVDERAADVFSHCEEFCHLLSGLPFEKLQWDRRLRQQWLRCLDGLHSLPSAVDRPSESAGSCATTLLVKGLPTTAGLKVLEELVRLLGFEGKCDLMAVLTDSSPKKKRRPAYGFINLESRRDAADFAAGFMHFKKCCTEPFAVATLREAEEHGSAAILNLLRRSSAKPGITTAMRFRA